MRHVLLATLGCLLALTAKAADRPNVLLLVSDDQRPDTIAALGNSYLRTPYLDRLAREGVTFVNATCANPICTPSRGELLTGVDGFRNGVRDFGGKLDASLPTLAGTLAEAGYRCAYVGKWHNDGRPTQRGYHETLGLFTGGGGKWWEDAVDDFGRPITGYRGWVFRDDAGNLSPDRGVGLTPDISARFADAAIEFLDRPTESPFFLHVNFTAPHDPLLWPPGYAGPRDPAAMPLPPNFLPEHPFDHGNFAGRDEKLLEWPRTPQAVRRELAIYYAVIEHLDAQVGRILDALRASGKAENTVVVFTSDHGLGVGSHGLRGKQNMYEHTLRVPLLVRGPGIPAGERRTALCYLRDLYPTFCELAGAPGPSVGDAESLLPVVRGKSDAVRDAVFGYFRDAQRMVRTQRHKLIWYPEVERVQLFDLASDPYELRNLADDAGMAGTRRELTARLAAWQEGVGDPVPPPPTE